MQELEEVRAMLEARGSAQAFEEWCKRTGNDMSAVYSKKLWGEFKEFENEFVQ